MTTTSRSNDLAYENAAGIDFDAEGHAPATLALVCGYCKRGEIMPMLEYEGRPYMQDRVCTGMECDCCLAEWEPDGTPRKGPHRAYFDYEQMVAFYNAQHAAKQASADEVEREAQEKA